MTQARNFKVLLKVSVPEPRQDPLQQLSVQVGVDIMLDASQEELRKKSIALCDLFIALVQQECSR